MAVPQVYDFAFVCCSIASFALLFWDHIITFGAGVQRMWLRKFSGATVLYALLRYGTLIEKISIMFLASWYMTPRGCDIVVRFQIFPMILRTLGFGAFSSLRVYALQRNRWPLAVFVFLLCMPSLVTPTYVYAHQISAGVDRNGCQLTYIASQTAHERMRIAGITADILGETIVIIVTLNRTFHLRNKAMPLDEQDRRPGLMQLLLRDGEFDFSSAGKLESDLSLSGSLYFVALLVLSLADMLVLLFDNAPRFATRYDYWVVPYYTPVFRTIIICRFLLMLRGIYYDERDRDDAEAPTGSLRFASQLIGPMGAPVESQFDDDSGPEPWDGDEDVVYSRDPLVTGFQGIHSSLVE